MQKNDDLLLSLDIDTPGKATEIVDLTFWMNPTSLKSYEYLEAFKTSLNKFGKYVKFKPLYKFKNLENEFVDDFLKQHCYYKGRYCAIDGTNLSSFSVLEEGIR